MILTVEDAYGFLNIAFLCTTKKNSGGIVASTLSL